MCWQYLQWLFSELTALDCFHGLAVLKPLLFSVTGGVGVMLYLDRAPAETFGGF
jgi:hypothetical protein